VISERVCGIGTRGWLGARFTDET